MGFGADHEGIRLWGPFFKIRGMVGLRALGWQADITDHRIMRPLFGERYGKDWTHRFHVGPFCFALGRVR